MYETETREWVRALDVRIYRLLERAVSRCTPAQAKAIARIVTQGDEQDILWKLVQERERLVQDRVDE